MPTKLFKKEHLQGILFEEEGLDDLLVHEEFIDSSRWSTHHMMIFKDEDKFYSAYFSRGATEQQEEAPFEYDEDEIKCSQVHEVEVLTKEWREVK